MILIADAFISLRTPNTLLNKCLKRPVPEVPSTSNMVNHPKYCWHLNHSTFTIFIHACEDNYCWKSLPEWYEKSQDCLLTHWVLIISILFLSETTYSNIFRCNYLTNGKEFVMFFFEFSKFRFRFQHFLKKDIHHTQCIFKLTDSEICCWDKCLNKPVPEHPSTSNMVNGPQHFSKLDESTFTIFLDFCEGNSGWQCPSEWYEKSGDCLLTHWLPMISFLLLTETIYWNIFRCNNLRNETYFLIFFYIF